MRRLIFALLLLTPAAVSASDLRELYHIEDASLRSVFFIDRKEGWVVGDEGVILHTLDGGRTWGRQPTGVRSSLRSVQFLTPEVGWAVGREELPYGMGSAGILLFTNDGGTQWKRQLANTLPGLNQVRFVNANVGFLLGDGSDAFPSGLFQTTDSGKSWAPVSGPRTTSWLTGDFFDANTGIMAGAWSRLATFRKDKTVFADHADWLNGRDITSMQILGKKTIAVGQGGLVLQSVSGGAAWGVPEKILAPELLANLDFHSVSAVKDKVWIVGRPGSVVVHSANAGATWTLQKTGQTLPLHAVFFFDDKTGWAVGDAATILATEDGGASWQTQHQGGKRVAAMVIHSLNRNAPVDAITQLGLVQGGLTTSLRITAPDANAVTQGSVQDERRYGAAMRLAGALTGETLWHFPTPQHLEGCDKKTIVAHWNQTHANRANEELIRQLVLSLRMWRPSVVVTESPESSMGMSALLGDAVNEAVRRAADSKQYPEQLSELKMEPWQVSASYSTGDVGAVTMDNEESLPRLQATVREHASLAQVLLVERNVSLPKRRSFQVMHKHNKTGGDGNLLLGVAMKTGENQRHIPPAEPDAKLQQILTARKSVMDMAENLDDPGRVLKLVPIALDKLPDEHAASATFAIANRFAERGQWYLAQEMFLYQIDRFPAHPLSAQAYRWLMRLNTSSEAKRRNELKHFALAEPIGLTRSLSIKNKVVQAGHVDRAPNAGQMEPSPDFRDWSKGSFEWAKRLAGFGSVYVMEPATQFCYLAAKRQVGDVGASNDGMNRMRKMVASGAWNEAAAAEVWLTERQRTPRGMARTRYTEVRPFLDGEFDDPCWKDVKPMLLDNAVGDSTKAYPTEAMFAYDQEFLYVALKCKHPAGQRVAPVKPRPRESDVEPFDRVSILLDLDRDYSTYYQLIVDQRGCVRTDCWGDTTWSPRWFVAVHSTEDCWQIEAAIPLAELTSERITQQTAWAFNVSRIMPGRGVQSWSQPADVQPRAQGMGLLLFQTAPTRTMPQP